MLNLTSILIIFLVIFAIFLEIILTTIAVLKIVQLEKKVIQYNKQLEIAGKIVTDVCVKIKETTKNINKIVRIITNKNTINTFKIIRSLINLVQIILLIRSLDLSKGLKSIKLKNIKKVVIIEFIRKLIRKAAF